MKKITFITQTMAIGGAEVFNLDLLETLQKQHHVQVTVFTTSREYQTKVSQAKLTAQHIPFLLDVIGDWKGLLKTFFWLPWALVWYCKTLWQQRHTDLILMSGFTEKLVVTPLAAALRIPVVWIEFGPLSTVLDKFLGLPRFWYESMCDLPTQVITSSLHTQRALSSELPFPQTIQVIQCGRRLEPLRKVKSQPKRLVCVSRLESGKGQDLLLQAMPVILQKHPTARLRIVGEGDFQATLEKVVKELQLQNNVEIVGKVPDALSELRAAEVVVFPSMWALEGFGIVLIEAMMQAKPIVAFQRGPTPEIIEDKKTGLLAESGNKEELAEKIKYIFEHPQFAEKISIQAQKAFKEKFTIEQSAQKYLDVLSTALAKS